MCRMKRVEKVRCSKKHIARIPVPRNVSQEDHENSPAYTAGLWFEETKE